ncbi:hypothetical protein SAMN05216312_110211 [Cohnella sp. OV330]|nr:hypothetical protein SAMN05216312_110211 [Cohnella sp. OV330]
MLALSMPASCLRQTTDGTAAASPSSVRDLRISMRSYSGTEATK